MAIGKTTITVVVMAAVAAARVFVAAVFVVAHADVAERAAEDVHTTMTTNDVASMVVPTAMDVVGVVLKMIPIIVREVARHLTRDLRVVEAHMLHQLLMDMQSIQGPEAMEQYRRPPLVQPS